MSQGTKTISAAVETDSDLAAKFEDYRESSSMTSKSEAVRHLLRAGLEKEYVSDDADSEQRHTAVDDDRTRHEVSSNPNVVTSGSSSDLIRGNEGFLLALVFLFQSDTVLSTSISGFGQQLGPAVYAVVGTLIVLVMFYQTAYPLVSDIVNSVRGWL